MISTGHSLVLQEQWLCLRRYGFPSLFRSSAFWRSCLASSRRTKRSGPFPVVNLSIKDDELGKNATRYRYCGFPLNILVMLPLLQPAAGTPIHGKDVVICKFPSDPTIAMGSMSLVALVVAAIIGHVAIFFPYSGKSVPRGALFQSTSLTVFFVVAE